MFPHILSVNADLISLILFNGFIKIVNASISNQISFHGHFRYMEKPSKKKSDMYYINSKPLLGLFCAY